MGFVKVDITISLDGFVAGPNPGPELGLGEGGERLHDWIIAQASWREAHGKEGGTTGPDSDIANEQHAGVGAVVMGKGMYGGFWGDDAWEGWWGDEPPFHMPVYVVTHQVREPLPMKGGTTYHFVNDGVESAIAQAQAAAGDKIVLIAGGGQVIQQALRAGLVDELQVHVAPVLLGDGQPLFDRLRAGNIELEPVRVVDSPAVTHLKYRVKKR